MGNLTILSDFFIRTLYSSQLVYWSVFFLIKLSSLQYRSKVLKELNAVLPPRSLFKCIWKNQPVAYTAKQSGSHQPYTDISAATVTGKPVVNIQNLSQITEVVELRMCLVNVFLMTEVVFFVLEHSTTRCLFPCDRHFFFIVLIWLSTKGILSRLFAPWFWTKSKLNLGHAFSLSYSSGVWNYYDFLQPWSYKHCLVAIAK